MNFRTEDAGLDQETLSQQDRLKELKFVGQIVSMLRCTLSYVILGVTGSAVCVYSYSLAVGRT